MHIPIDDTGVQGLTAEFTLVNLRRCEIAIAVPVDDISQSLLYATFQLADHKLHNEMFFMVRLVKFFECYKCSYMYYEVNQQFDKTFLRHMFRYFGCLCMCDYLTSRRSHWEQCSTGPNFS